MRKQANLWAVIATLVASALFALLITWLVSIVLVNLGIAGFLHMIALMLVMPIAFAVIALLLARKVLLD